jgi:cytochrome c oxidase subunit III
MSGERRVLDVSGLSTVPFGRKSLTWWGTLGFMVIEGFTLALMSASYFYLRLNESAWPPGRTPVPDLLFPTLDAAWLLLVILPMLRAKRAAERRDRRAVGRWLLVATLMTVPALALRWLALLALQVRWDAHAYASAAWGVVVLHATLVVTDLFETGTLAAIFLSGRAEKKHYPDAADAADYQLYLSLAFVPLYLIVYWGPRVL